MQNDIKKEIKRQPCQIFSRVNGWFTAITSWNPGKVAEWKDRKPYNKDYE